MKTDGLTYSYNGYMIVYEMRIWFPTSSELVFGDAGKRQLFCPNRGIMILLSIWQDASRYAKKGPAAYRIGQQTYPVSQQCKEDCGVVI